MNTKILKVLIPTMIGGELITAGELIEVTDREARELEARGRAAPHKVKETPADNAAARPGRKEKA